jgi:hypothetical protein
MPGVAYERRARSASSYMAQGAACIDEALDTEIHGILPRIELEDGLFAKSIHRCIALDIPLTIKWKEL